MQNFLILNSIDEGSYGNIFKIQNINTGQKYAMKSQSLQMPGMCYE